MRVDRDKIVAAACGMVLGCGAIGASGGLVWESSASTDNFSNISEFQGNTPPMLGTVANGALPITQWTKQTRDGGYGKAGRPLTSFGSFMDYNSSFSAYYRFKWAQLYPTRGGLDNASLDGPFFHFGFETSITDYPLQAGPQMQLQSMNIGGTYYIRGYAQAAGSSTTEVAVPGGFFTLGTDPFSADYQFAIGYDAGTRQVTMGLFDQSGQPVTDSGNPFKLTFTVPGSTTANFDFLGLFNTSIENPLGGDVVAEKMNLKSLQFYDDATGGLDAVKNLSATQWAVDGDGNWSVASNWDGGVPNAAGATANFGTKITAAHTVTVDAPQTVGVMNFSSPAPNTYTIAGTSTLTLDGGSGSTSINVTAGSPVISAPIVLAKDTTVAVSGGGNLSIAHVRGAGLSITSGAVKVLANATPNSAAGTSMVTSLAIASGASLDLTNNSAVIDYTGSVGTLVEDTRQMISSAKLISSSADATKNLGYADNTALGMTSFAGQTVDSSSVLIKYTYLGDTNLDGQVDVIDLGNLATAWQTNGTWANGDSNYDGFVDVIDLGQLATNWQAGVGSPLGPGSLDQALAAFGLPSVPVPEPACFAMLGLAAGVVTARRRR